MPLKHFVTSLCAHPAIYTSATPTHWSGPTCHSDGNNESEGGESGGGDNNGDCDSDGDNESDGERKRDGDCGGSADNDSDSDCDGDNDDDSGAAPIAFVHSSMLMKLNRRVCQSVVRSMNGYNCRLKYSGSKQLQTLFPQQWYTIGF